MIGEVLIVIVLVPYSESQPLREYNHRHVAAGSSRGGQFASAEGVTIAKPETEVGWPHSERAINAEQRAKRDQWNHQVEAWALEAAKELGFDATFTNQYGDKVSRLQITDSPVRTFEVAGVTMGEGGHYNPANGYVHINANGFRLLSEGDQRDAMRAIKGIAAHEIQHAMWEVFRTEMERESIAFKALSSSEVNELMRASGEIRPEKREWFNATFPAHAAIEDTWGSGWTSGNKISDRMKAADGCSDYSRLYWTESTQTGGHSSYRNYLGYDMFKGRLDRAVDETLAEVAKFRVLQADDSKVFRATGLIQRGHARENVPTRDWQKFQNKVRTFYKAHVKGGGRG